MTNEDPITRRRLMLGATATGLMSLPVSACSQQTQFTEGEPMSAQERDTAWWDDAYANGAYIPNAQRFYTQWVEDAAAFRAEAGQRAEVDLAYGPGVRNAMDLILPEGTPKGLAVFVHGGYWLQTDKSMWSHLVRGAVKAGWAGLVPSYTLAPDARLAQMTQEVARAIRLAATRVAGPVRISGHSAGGHLAMRMACADKPLGDLTNRLEVLLGISGLYDLRPLMKTSMNLELRIDDAEAKAESPALLQPVSGIEAVSWVGGDERPEFIRQSKLLVEAWEGLSPTPALVIDDGFHHFDVIAGLSEPESPITRRWLG